MTVYEPATALIETGLGKKTYNDYTRSMADWQVVHQRLATAMGKVF